MRSQRRDSQLAVALAPEEFGKGVEDYLDGVRRAKPWGRSASRRTSADYRSRLGSGRACVHRVVNRGCNRGAETVLRRRTGWWRQQRHGPAMLVGATAARRSS